METIQEQAEKSTQIKGLVSISEGSLDFEIINIVDSLLNRKNPKEKSRILIKDISSKLPEGHKAHEKTIRKHMQNFGFDDSYDRFRNGCGWELSYELFESLIIPIFPSLRSLDSQEKEIKDDKVTIQEIEDVNVCESNVGKCEAKQGISDFVHTRSQIHNPQKILSSRRERGEANDPNLQIKGGVLQRKSSEFFILP